jgi:ribose/xylose/arabinose/galactoside ABC-type transport system permease subunit
MWPLAALILILAFDAIYTPGFFHVSMREGRLYGSVIDILNRAAPVLLLSIGMTLVIATGGVDLSVGAIMAIAGATAAGLLMHPRDTPFAHLGSSPPFVVLCVVALAVSALAGMFNGLLVGKGGVQPIVATLILMVAGRGVAQLLTGGQIVVFQDASLAGVGGGAVVGVPMPIILFLIAWSLAALLVRKTALGLFIEAVGSSAPAARLAGINANGIKIFAYTISGLMAGVAGLIVCGQIKGADAGNAGLYLELDAILAVAIGGTALTGGKFSLGGSALGALVMQALTTTMVTIGVPYEATLVAKSLIIVALCLAQSPQIALRRKPA